MTKKQIKWRNRIIVALVIFFIVFAATEFLPLDAWLGSETNAVYLEFALFLIPYLIAGYDVVVKAVKNIGHGQVFDENLLMTIATVGAFAMVFFPETGPHMAEGAAVMLFYQVGELFQSYAVGKSRKSIADMMDIAPDYANIMQDGELIEVDPDEVEVGDEIVVKAGERIPIDGVIVKARHRGTHRRGRPARRRGGRRGILRLREFDRCAHHPHDEALRRIDGQPHP